MLLRENTKGGGSFDDMDIYVSLRGGVQHVVLRRQSSCNRRQSSCNRRQSSCNRRKSSCVCESIYWGRSLLRARERGNRRKSSCNRR